MKDPVQGSDGHTYERSAIINALQIKSESPMTRQRMTINDLKVNVALKFLCDNYNSWIGSSLSVSPSPSEDKPIILDHTISKSTKNLLLTFNVNNESFPKDLNAHKILC